MNAPELEAYLHANIPVTAAMEVSAIDVSPNKITLGAPLAPNTNHRNTAFGGSVSTLATLAAWSFLRIRLGGDATGVHLVVQRNNVEYLKPITGFFTASASLAADMDWARFERTLAQKNRARISIEAVVEFEQTVCAKFVGDFVALVQ